MIYDPYGKKATIVSSYFDDRPGAVVYLRLDLSFGSFKILDFFISDPMVACFGRR